MKDLTPAIRQAILEKDAEVMENLRAFYETDALNAVSELANLVNVGVIAASSRSPLTGPLLEVLGHLTPLFSRALKLDEKKVVADIGTLARIRRWEQ